MQRLVLDVSAFPCSPLARLGPPMYRSLPPVMLRSCLPSLRCVQTMTPGAGGEKLPRLLAPSARSLLAHYGLSGEGHVQTVLTDEQVSNEKAVLCSGSEMPATGPRNILLKQDVIKHIMQNSLTPPREETVPEVATPTSDKGIVTRASGRREKRPKFTDIELTNMRRVIAKRLTESKSSIPHSYASATCDVSATMQHRRWLKEAGVRVSVNDYVIKASALSLKKMPQMNSRWKESNFTLESVKSVDISIAVSTPTGLITPIVKGANRLSLPEIAACVAELSSKARAGKLQPHEFLGGSFSISNLGMFGVAHFAAVINPPQTAILAVGCAQPLLRADQTWGEQLFLTLSYDARAVDEEQAALFLEQMTAWLQDPHLMSRAGDGDGHRRLAALIS